MSKEHSDSHWIICPYCGHKNDSNEIGLEEVWQEPFWCNSCGGKFLLTNHVSTLYVTEGIDG